METNIIFTYRNYETDIELLEVKSNDPDTTIGTMPTNGTAAETTATEVTTKATVELNARNGRDTPQVVTHIENQSTTNIMPNTLLQCPERDLKNPNERRVDSDDGASIHTMENSQVSDSIPPNDGRTNEYPKERPSNDTQLSNNFGVPKLETYEPEKHDDASESSNNGNNNSSHQETNNDKNHSVMHLGQPPQISQYPLIQDSNGPQNNEEPDNGLTMLPPSDIHNATHLLSHHSNDNMTSYNDLQNQTTAASEYLDHNELSSHDSEPSNESVEVNSEGSPQDTTSEHTEHNGDCNTLEHSRRALHHVGEETVQVQQVTGRKSSEASQDVIVIGRESNISTSLLHSDLYPDKSEKNERTEHRERIAKKVYQDDSLMSHNNSEPPTEVQDDSFAEDPATSDT